MCSAYFIRSSLSWPGCRPAPSVTGRRDRARAPERGGATRRDGRRWPRMDDYLEVNRLNWDERATVHAASARVRVRPLRHRPRPPQRRRALRPAAARRRHRADRHPPAVPHRHRHAVAGPARGADDRPRPVAGVAGAGAAARRRCRGGRRLRRGRHLLGAAGARADAPSTSSTPASARCAGCPTSTAGPASSTTCSSPAAGCSSARATR